MKQIILVSLVMILAACDSGSSRSSAPLNVAPVISAIADQAGGVNGNLVTEIAITDDRDGVSELVVSVSADNPDVVADIQVEAIAGGRRLTIVPAIDVAGSSNLTVVVTDSSGLSAEAAFNARFDFVATSFDTLLQTVVNQPLNGTPVSLNEFNVSPVETDFNNLLGVDT